MSSLLRQRVEPKHTDTRLLSIRSPSYVSVLYGSSVILFPFTYSNGVLDLNIQDDVQSLITAGTFDAGNNHLFPVKLLGGTHMVSSIGSNFDAYVRSVIKNINSLAYNYTNSITVYVPPVVTKVQASMPVAGQLPPLLITRSMHDSLVPPSSDGYNYAGSDSDHWRTYWVFKTPLTLQYIIGVTNKYLTFTTRFEYQ